MHSLTICFGPTCTIWTLLFKTEENARGAYADASKLANEGVELGIVVLSDDFGQEAVIKAAEIRGLMLEDMDESQMAQIERGLHQARAQAKAETRAMSDEVIKGAMRAKQMGPAVMSPVPGGRFNG